MKKTFAIFIFISVTAIANACPLCGCGVNNFYMGILPSFKKSFVGVRYQYLQYHTQIKGDAEQFGNDYYSTVDVWGGYNLGSKWQLIGFVPYIINKQVTDDGTSTNTGFGDITLLTNYRILQTTKMNTVKKSSFSQQLWIGGGVKLPTGKFNVGFDEQEALTADINSQQGSGSVDFLINGSYNILMNKFGINNTANYKINTANKDDYTFGNRFSASSLAYYNVQLKKTLLGPNAGIMYEHAAGNKFESVKVNQTGGYAAYAVAGAEFNIKSITIGANAQLPFTQNFSENQTKAKFRGMLHVSFSL